MYRNNDVCYLNKIREAVILQTSVQGQAMSISSDKHCDKFVSRKVDAIESCVFEAGQ